MRERGFSRILIAIILLVTSLSGVAAGGRAENDSTGHLSLGVLPDVDSIPFIIAHEKGFFLEEGVELELARFNSPVVRDTALQAGKIDGAVSDVLAAAFAVEGDFPVVITSKTEGSYKFLAAPDSEIKEVSDIRGKTVAMSRNTIIEYCADRFLAEAGIPPKEIIKTAIPQIPVRVEMLKEGLVHSAVLPEPLASVAKAGGATVVKASEDLGINPGVVLFRRSVVDEKGPSVKAMYRGYNRAVALLREIQIHQLEELLIEKAGFPEDIRGNLSLPDYPAASLPPRKEVDEVIRWLLEKELISRRLEYDDLVFPKLLPAD